MMCNHCYQTVTKAVESEPNVKRVRIHRDIVTVWYEDEIDIDKIIANIIERGYVTKKEYVSENVHFCEHRRWNKEI